MRAVVRRGALGAVAACIVATAAIALSGVEAQGIGVSGGRVDFGPVARGGAAAASFTVHAPPATAASVEVTVEHDPGGALTATPTSGWIPAGGMLVVSVTLAVPADAHPGRHQPAVVVAQTAAPDGTLATGAARVPVTYVVEAIDVAGVFIGDNGLLQIRVVNGHATTRSAQLDTSFATPTQTGSAGPVSMAAGASWLVDWVPDWSRVANGTHTLQMSGSATGGPLAEGFDAAVPISVAGNDKQIGHLTTPRAAAGGGGGGGAGGGGGGGGSTAPGTTTESVDDNGPAPNAPPGHGGGPGGTMPPLPPGLGQGDLQGDAVADDATGDSDHWPAADASSASCVVALALALAGSAAAAYGLRRAFKNIGNKRPPSGAS